MNDKYCIYCGAQNNITAEFCTACGKEMEPQENLLVDFLVKRTKDKFKGTAQDSLYEAVKNFLLSHIYGATLTISFVSAMMVTVYAAQPLVTEMTNQEVMNYIEKDYVNTDKDSTPVVYNTEYNHAVHNLVNHYEHEIFNPAVTDSSGKMVASNPAKYRLPSSYGYGGVHQLSQSLPSRIDGASMSGTTNRTEFEKANFHTEVAKALYDDGYTVGECVVERSFEADGEIVAEYSYLVVSVLMDGQWLIAEDISGLKLSAPILL